MRGFLSPLVLLFLTSSAGAEEGKLTPDYRKALNNYQHEMVTCAAYFGLVGKCLSENTLSQRYIALAINLNVHAIKVGEQIGMTYEAMKARSELSVSEMKALVAGDCINISSAYARHMKRCETVVRDPSAVVDQYLRK